MSDVPQWIEDRVALCRDALGCHDIHIGMSMSDAPGGNPRNWAVTESNYDCLSARVIFRRDLENNEFGRCTIDHEMLHIALMHIVDHVELIIGMLPDDKQMDADRILRAGLEPNIEHMARALTPFLDGWQATTTATQGDDHD